MSGNDYCNSFSAYWDFLRQPNLPFADMLKLSGDGPALFTEWSIAHLLLYIIVVVIWSILVVVNGADPVSVLIAALIGFLVAYFLSHLGWFIIAVNNGCCHPCVSALLGIIFIFWGIHYCAYGINGSGAFSSPHLYSHDGEVSAVVRMVRLVLFLLYGISLVYMGISAIICCNNATGTISRGADDLEVASGENGRSTASGGDEKTHVHVHHHSLGKSMEAKTLAEHVAAEGGTQC